MKSIQCKSITAPVVKLIRGDLDLLQAFPSEEKETCAHLLGVIHAINATTEDQWDLQWAEADGGSGLPYVTNAARTEFILPSPVVKLLSLLPV